MLEKAKTSVKRPRTTYTTSEYEQREKKSFKDERNDKEEEWWRNDDDHMYVRGEQEQHGKTFAIFLSLAFFPFSAILMRYSLSDFSYLHVVTSSCWWNIVYIVFTSPHVTYEVNNLACRQKSITIIFTWLSLYIRWYESGWIDNLNFSNFSCRSHIFFLFCFPSSSLDSLRIRRATQSDNGNYTCKSFN